MTTIRKLWDRTELLLAMNLYCRIPFGRQHSQAPEIIDLAQVLGRTPGSVAMKLNNITSLDPEEKARGIKGLLGASNLDRQVWNEFHTNWEEMVAESELLGNK
jgi:putative restriction endonuclease